MNHYTQWAHYLLQGGSNYDMSLSGFKAILDELGSVNDHKVDNPAPWRAMKLPLPATEDSLVIMIMVFSGPTGASFSPSTKHFTSLSTSMRMRAEIPTTLTHRHVRPWVTFIIITISVVHSFVGIFIIRVIITVVIIHRSRVWTHGTAWAIGWYTARTCVSAFWHYRVFLMFFATKFSRLLCWWLWRNFGTWWWQWCRRWCRWWCHSLLTIASRLSLKILQWQIDMLLNAISTLPNYSLDKMTANLWSDQWTR